MCRWACLTPAGGPERAAFRTPGALLARYPARAARQAYPDPVDPLLVLIGVPIAILLAFAIVLAWHPRRGRELVGELRPGRDYERMVDIEASDTDAMLDATNEYRRRAGRRSVGDELADELTRGTWEPPAER